MTKIQLQSIAPSAFSLCPYRVEGVRSKPSTRLLRAMPPATGQFDSILEYSEIVANCAVHTGAKVILIPSETHSALAYSLAKIAATYGIRVHELSQGSDVASQVLHDSDLSAELTHGTTDLYDQVSCFLSLKMKRRPSELRVA